MEIMYGISIDIHVSGRLKEQQLLIFFCHCLQGGNIYCIDNIL